MIIKRMTDIILALLVLLFLSPLLVVIYLVIFFNLGSPVFFIQDRVGKNNKVFKMIKFRTMKNLFDKDGKELPDSMRLTKLGKVLRSLSIDELPELFNVIKGDMSLVGPRPLLVQYLPKYTEIQLRRHEVLPGLTGLAQINGRNTLTWKNKFELDVWYVDNWCIKLDIQIFFKTIVTVLKREGINQNQNVTMEYFNGSN